MDNPGRTVSEGDRVTFYVEAIFKYDPGSVILWFQSAENSSSRKSAACRVTAKTSDNIYEVTLDISNRPRPMFPGKWIPDWYYISDCYNTFTQEDFTAQQQQEMWFVVN